MLCFDFIFLTTFYIIQPDRKFCEFPFSPGTLYFKSLLSLETCKLEDLVRCLELLKLSESLV